LLGKALETDEYSRCYAIGRKQSAISKKWLGNTSLKQQLFKKMFSIRSVKVVIKKIIGRGWRPGSNTSTMTLRVVGGDEKRSLKCETVKYGRKPQGTRTRETLRWQGPAAYIKGRPILSSETAPHRNKTVTVEEQ
jgi:hypothetical protein